MCCSFLSSPPDIFVPDGTMSESDYKALMSALSEKSYPRIYKMVKSLSRRGLTCTPVTAHHLLDRALHSGLTLTAFHALLECCPPVPEIVEAWAENWELYGEDCIDDDCVCTAAWRDRADVLALFLQRGASPNRCRDEADSPLEAALLHRSLKCVQLLMARPELDNTWTESLLAEWGGMGMSPALDFCLQAMAHRFTGWDAVSLEPLPIPEPMTARIPTEVQNWPLLERLCHERGSVPLEEGRAALNAIKPLTVTKQDQAGCAAAVRALLERCHGLLRREKDCQRLLGCFLFFQALSST